MARMTALVPSAKKLKGAFPKLSIANAKTLSKWMKQAVSHEEVDAALEEANRLIGGFGVEAINSECTSPNDSRYYGDIVALYVNVGDTYDTTILYDTVVEQFIVTSFGGWFEDFENDYCEREEEEEETEEEPEEKGPKIKNVVVTEWDAERYRVRFLLEDGKDLVISVDRPVIDAMKPGAESTLVGISPKEAVEALRALASQELGVDPEEAALMVDLEGVL